MQKMQSFKTYRLVFTIFSDIIICRKYKNYTFFMLYNKQNLKIAQEKYENMNGYI